MDQRENHRFWFSFVVLVPYSLFFLICFTVIDGHWWVGHISTAFAVFLLAALCVPIIILSTTIAVLSRRGHRRAHEINQRETVYDHPEKIDTSAISWPKLVFLLIALPVCIFAMGEVATRLLNGLPAHIRPYRGRYRLFHEILGPWLPEGPLTPILFGCLLVLAMCLVIWIGWRKLKTWR
ncbi:hypothetical protein [Neorhizobium alkalisoli]|uniref:hypothetical protein n=1 Tax=Neorhizobium alkalisoli TaxID=528178 RepID=UPI001646E13B|nr:hypothetical protein [Neorhizobium alkalisoli]